MPPGKPETSTRNRFVVLVDAGYLLSQSVQALSSMKSKARKDVTIDDPPDRVSMITSNVAAALGDDVNLLRAYWYDGVFGRMSNEQEALALLPGVQLRQGLVTRSGMQKDIDSKMLVDLMELSTSCSTSHH
jgi:hypothetical protein